ncbi:hypothetical protein SUGI_1019820 [Cryptomeria japonica]|nr:hypothetical protein SUGI_1019820 [Cryptomeria japonica]
MNEKANSSSSARHTSPNQPRSHAERSASAMCNSCIHLCHPWILLQLFPNQIQSESTLGIWQQESGDSLSREVVLDVDYIISKLADSVNYSINLLPRIRIGSNTRLTVPIMPNHVALIRIGNQTSLKLFQSLKSSSKLGFHRLHKFIRKPNSADIDIQFVLFVLIKPIQVLIP